MTARSRNNGRTHAFARAAATSSTDECILWPFATTQGYGAMTWDGRSIRAHRQVLILATGGPPTPGRWDAAHAPGICHNPACVNPRHLRWATPKENNHDRWIDRTVPLGEAHHLTTLTKADAMAIAASDEPTKVLAERYGVSDTTVRNIRNGRRWRVVPPRTLPLNIKLSDADIEAIRRDTRNQSEIARAYGVKPSTINKIVRGRRRTEPSPRDYLVRRGAA